MVINPTLCEDITSLWFSFLWSLRFLCNQWSYCFLLPAGCTWEYETVVPCLFIFGSSEAIIVAESKCNMWHNWNKFHSNATDCAKQVVWPASCFWCHQGVEQYQLMKTCKVSCLERNFVLVTTSKVPKVKSQNQYMYKSWDSPPSSAKLAGFLDYQVMDWRNFAVIWCTWFISSHLSLLIRN